MVGGVHRQSRGHRSACTRTLFSRLRNGTSTKVTSGDEWYWANTVLKLTSRKTEIAKSARGLKLKVPLAEDALAKQYLEQRSLVTWSQQITKSSTRRVNLGTITSTLSWYKILKLNGFNLIREQKTSQETEKRAYKSSWNRRGNQKLFTQTIHWSLANPVRNFHGIIELRHLIDPRQTVLLRERCGE